MSKTDQREEFQKILNWVWKTLNYPWNYKFRVTGFSIYSYGFFIEVIARVRPKNNSKLKNAIWTIDIRTMVKDRWAECLGFRTVLNWDCSTEYQTVISRTVSGTFIEHVLILCEGSPK